MPSEPVTCAAVADALPHIAEGAEPAPTEIRAHVESCLRCQAELVQYRRVLRSLRALRTEVLEPAPGTLTHILAGLEAAGERGAIRSLLEGRRSAYLAGLGVATAAAGAAGAVVLVSRARRGRIRLAG